MKTRIGMGLTAIGAAALLVSGCLHDDDGDAALMAKLKTAEEALATARTDLAAANASLTAAQAEIEAKQAEIDDLNTRVMVAENARDEAQMALAQAMADDDADTAEISRLTSELATANAALTTARAALATANADRTALRAQVAMLEARVAELEAAAGNGNGEPPPDDDMAGTPADSAMLAQIGTARRTGTSSYSVTTVGGRFPGTFSGTRPVYDFGDWGVEVTQGASTLFKAVIRENTNIFSSDDYDLHTEGTRTGSNPALGSAVWTGDVRAYDAHPEKLGTPVEGSARLEMDFSAVTIDVDFTGFSGGHADMAWDGLALTNGAFSHRSGFESLNGAFYGAGHEAVGGTFKRDRLDGVFGALRE